MAYMLVTIIKFKMNAFYSLLSGSYILAFLIRMPLTDINGAIQADSPVLLALWVS